MYNFFPCGTHHAAIVITSIIIGVVIIVTYSSQKNVSIMKTSLVGALVSLMSLFVALIIREFGIRRLPELLKFADPVDKAGLFNQGKMELNKCFSFESYFVLIPVIVTGVMIVMAILRSRALMIVKNKQEPLVDANNFAMNGMQEQELMAFVGENSWYYQSKWNSSQKPQQYAGWNWSACLFGIFWLGYRKTYQMIPLLLMAFFVVEQIPIKSKILDFLIALTPWPTIGLFGNRFYFNHTKKKISKIRLKQDNSEKLTAELSQSGGTSWFGVGIAFLLLVAYAVINVSIEVVIKGEKSLISSKDETKIEAVDFEGAIKKNREYILKRYNGNLMAITAEIEKNFQRNTVHSLDLAINISGTMYDKENNLSQKFLELNRQAVSRRDILYQQLTKQIRSQVPQAELHYKDARKLLLESNDIDVLFFESARMFLFDEALNETRSMFSFTSDQEKKKFLNLGVALRDKAQKLENSK